jgi:hypothetical protein
MDSKLFKDSMQMNQSIVMSMYEYLRTRKKDIAIALELTQPVRGIAVGVIFGAAIYYGLGYKSAVHAPTRFGAKEKVAFINPQGNSVVEMTINEFEFYAAPYLLNRLDLIRSTALSSIKTSLHTEACFQEQVNVAINIAEWKLQWPNHCRSCNGASGHGYGPTQDEPGGFDLCSCVSIEDNDARPKCPRCGKQWPIQIHTDEGYAHVTCAVTDNPTPCPFCKWNWGNGKEDVLPEWPGCDCTN